MSSLDPHHVAATLRRAARGRRRRAIAAITIGTVLVVGGLLILAGIAIEAGWWR